MEKNSLLKSAFLMLIFVIAVIAFWEISLSEKGVIITYDDGPPFGQTKEVWFINQVMKL